MLPPEERVVTVEDTPELQLGLDNWIAMVTTEETEEGQRAITLDDLVINALRMRPDRIVTGEARGAEIRSVLMAASAQPGTAQWFASRYGFRMIHSLISVKLSGY